MEGKSVQAWYYWVAMVVILAFQYSQKECLCAAMKPQKRIKHHTSSSNTNPVSASFIFGDSLVDAGNNNYIGSLARANYGANGVDFPGGQATGRFCNGRTVADIIGKLARIILLRTFHTNPVSASFIFGDSLVDAGNNNYIGSLARANYGANGVDFPGGQATGRFCNGRTVADIIDQLLGIPFGPVFLNPAAKGKALLKGVNYASGGAGILDFTGYTFVNRIPMWEQIEMFRNTTQQIVQMLGTAAAEELVQTAMYSIAMGSNDYLNNYLTDGSPSPMLFTPEQFQLQLITTYRQQLSALVELGARKFVLMNVGPLGCIPYRMTMQATQQGRCVHEDNHLVSGFNAALKRLVDELNSDNHAASPTAQFVVADSYHVVMQIINNPSVFGFATKDQACCGMPIGEYHGLTPCFPGVPFCKNRKSHLFWDTFHPSDAANDILGHRFFSGTVADIYPINVQQLAALQLIS